MEQVTIVRVETILIKENKGKIYLYMSLVKMIVLEK
jgi:hypothetical protein